MTNYKLDTKDLIVLPKVGDLVTFTRAWDKVLARDGRYPYGLVTNILEYDSLLIEEGESELIGTLVFPLEDLDAYKKNFKVFVVRWGDNKDNSFRLINEEWFHNKSFIVVTKTS